MTPDPEPEDTFVYDDFIRVTSNGGNIGRLFWCNASHFTIETGRTWPLFPWSEGYEIDTTILPGSCAFIATVGDFWAWIISD